jgi:DNA repair protein RadC
MKNAIQLSMFNVAEVQLIYRLKVPASQRRFIKCSRDAFDLFLQSWNPDTIEHSEEFKPLLMNRSNAVLGILPVSKADLSGTVTDVRIIVQAAIKANASGIIVAHNHPSGGYIIIMS